MKPREACLALGPAVAVVGLAFVLQAASGERAPLGPPQEDVIDVAALPPATGSGARAVFGVDPSAGQVTAHPVMPATERDGRHIQVSVTLVEADGHSTPAADYVMPIGSDPAERFVTVTLEPPGGPR